MGSEADSAKVQQLLAELKGKDLAEVIATGSKKLASVPSGGAGGAAAAPAAAAAGGAAPAAKKEEKKEEKEEEEEVRARHGRSASRFRFRATDAPRTGPGLLSLRLNVWQGAGCSCGHCTAKPLQPLSVLFSNVTKCRAYAAADASLFTRRRSCYATSRAVLLTRFQSR